MKRAGIVICIVFAMLMSFFINGATAQDTVDLIALPITYNGETIEVGDTVFFDTGVKNAGTVDVDGFNIMWFVNRVRTGYGYHEGVPADTSNMDGNSRFYWHPLKAGEYRISFYVAPDGVYDDNNRANNESSIWVEVVGGWESDTDVSPGAAPAIDFLCAAEDGVLSITVYDGNDLNVIIPEKIDGYTVEQIGEDAFTFYSSVKTITIPITVSYIHPAAFNADNLQKLYVYNGSYAQQYAEENGIVYQFADSAVSQEEIATALQQSSWQYERTETRSDTVEGPDFETNAHYADENIIIKTFKKDGTMVTSYTPRTGGDPVVFEDPYTIDDNSRALIQNDDFEFNGKPYAFFIEYTLNGDGELVSRMMMVDRATSSNDYFGNANIYTPVAVYGQQLVSDSSSEDHSNEQYNVPYIETAYSRIETGLGSLVRLENTDSYDFYMQTKDYLSNGDMYYFEEEFWCNNEEQQGVAEVGKKFISTLMLNTARFTRFGVAAIQDHYYIVLSASYGEDYYTLFRVIEIGDTWITLEYCNFKRQ